MKNQKRKVSRSERERRERIARISVAVEFEGLTEGDILNLVQYVRHMQCGDLLAQERSDLDAR